MLGPKTVDPALHPFLLSLFRLTQCVGIVGGKNGKAFYLFGYQGSALLYLDPHYVQKIPKDATNRSTYINTTPRLLPITDLESSMVVAFLLQSRQDLQDLTQAIDTSVIYIQDQTESETLGGGTVETMSDDSFEVL
jgi:cysteine protease ATG4